MKRVYVNEKWCLACHLCEYYCAFANSNERYMDRALKNLKIRPRIHIEEHNGISFAVSCRHCESALCVKSCISGALSKQDGLVVIDPDVCVGCYTCVLTCPYGAITPDGDAAVIKCELCVKNASGQPRCVEGCPNQAIVFEER